MSMARSNMLRLARIASCNAGPSSSQRSYTSAIRAISFQHAVSPHLPATGKPIVAKRSISSTRTTPKGIQPETEDPQLKETWQAVSREPTKLTDEQYHKVSDAYLESMIAQFEQLQEDREDVDVEYSAGVLTLTFPPNGTYVINKQPPNKQIWLSSPISGPKRYDWVMSGDGQNEKEGCGSGEWIYLRDNSTLSGLLTKEIGVDVTATSLD